MSTAEASRKWRANNPERTRELARKNRRTRRQKDNEYQNRWNALHPQKARDRAKKWNKENPEKVRARTKRWRKENPEKAKAQRHKRRAFALGSEGTFTAQEWDALKVATGSKCLCCHRTEEELLSTGLKLVPDHVVALVNGGSNDISNIQPLCHGRGGCNNRKSTKTEDYRKTQENHGDEE